MKKGYFVAAVAIIAVAVICGVWFYHYNYVEVVTERYIVTVPKMEVKELTQYASDSVAVEKETANARDYRKKLLEMYDKEDFTDEDELTEEAKMNAYKNLMEQSSVLFSISHVRSTSPEEALEIIKEHGLLSNDVVEFAEENKIHVEVYQLD